MSLLWVIFAFPVTELGPVFAHLFQQSIYTGEIPKKGKKNRRTLASNYRPVSLSCVSCKLLEHIHTGKCIRRFAGIYAYCRYFIDRKWQILVLIMYRKACQMPKGL